MPPRHIINSHPSLVCQLKKTLYGLKQSPRLWFGQLTQTIKALGYQQNNGNHTSFFRHTPQSITILLVYVDDMIITGNDKKQITSLTN